MRSVFFAFARAAKKASVVSIPAVLVGMIFAQEFWHFRRLVSPPRL
jgi:hypothetical protein